MCNAGHPGPPPRARGHPRRPKPRVGACKAGASQPHTHSHDSALRSGTSFRTLPPATRGPGRDPPRTYSCLYKLKTKTQKGNAPAHGASPNTNFKIGPHPIGPKIRNLTGNGKHVTKSGDAPATRPGPTKIKHRAEAKRSKEKSEVQNTSPCGCPHGAGPVAIRCPFKGSRYEPTGHPTR